MWHGRGWCSRRGYLKLVAVDGSGAALEGGSDAHTTAAVLPAPAGCTDGDSSGADASFGAQAAAVGSARGTAVATAADDSRPPLDAVSGGKTDGTITTAADDGDAVTVGDSATSAAARGDDLEIPRQEPEGFESCSEDYVESGVALPSVSEHTLEVDEDESGSGADEPVTVAMEVV